MPGKSAGVLRAADQARVDAKGLCSDLEAIEDISRRGMKPCVETFISGMDDGGESPVEKLPKPTNKSKGGLKMISQLDRSGGLDSIEAVEVEDGVWGGEHVGCGSGIGTELPSRGCCHWANGSRCCEPNGNWIPAVGVERFTTIMDSTGPDDRIAREEAANEMTGTGLHEAAFDALGAIFPNVGRLPRVASHEGLAMLSGSMNEMLSLDPIALLSGTLVQPLSMLMGIRLVV